jgi:hypothetical protein
MKVSGQLHALVTLPMRKDPQVPIRQEASGPQSWSGYGYKTQMSNL